MLAYVANNKQYGPILLDELMYTDQIPPGSPQPVPGADSGNAGVGGVNVTVNEGDQVANLGLVPGAYSNKNYSCLILNLTTGTTQKEINFEGTMLQVVWGDSGSYPNGPLAVATSSPVQDPTALAFIQINSTGADPIPVSAGFQLSGIPFNKLYISWPAQASKTLVILLSSDAPLDRLDAAL